MEIQTLRFFTMATSVDSLTSEMRFFLQTISDGCLFVGNTLRVPQVPVCFEAHISPAETHEMPCGRAGLSISASPGWGYRTQILFAQELLLIAVLEIAEEVVLNSLSKAEVVAYYLNSKLSENKGKNPDDWVLKYSSGFGG